MDGPSAEMAAILDAMPLKFFHKDTKNGVLHCNKAIADSLGVKPSDLTNTETSRWYPDEAEMYDLLPIMSFRRNLDLSPPAAMACGAPVPVPVPAPL